MAEIAIYLVTYVACGLMWAWVAWRVWKDER
jgi:hypothetical protein